MPAPALRPEIVPAQRIDGLVARVPGARLVGDGAVTVTGITHDSRLVRAGDIYVARAGQKTHGIDHVADAVRAGAPAVLTDAASVPAAVAAGAAAVVEVDDPQLRAGPA